MQKKPEIPAGETFNRYTVRVYSGAGAEHVAGLACDVNAASHTDALLKAACCVGEDENSLYYTVIASPESERKEYRDMRKSAEIAAAFVLRRAEVYRQSSLVLTGLAGQLKDCQHISEYMRNELAEWLVEVSKL